MKTTDKDKMEQELKKILAKPKVLVADPLPQEIIDQMKATADVEAAYKLPKETLIEKVKDIQGLVVRSETKVTQEIIEAGKSLKVIARAGVGVDNIDVEAATKQGIIVINSPDGNTLAAAEHTMAMVLAIARKIPQAHQSTSHNEWERSKFVGTELYGKTLGIVGLGRIGREVAARASSFKMQILGYDPYVNESYANELRVKMVPLETLLKQSDFVTLHMPVNAETEKLLNKERFAMMKKGSILINCARGGLVSEEALIEALKNGPIAGAALDVYAKEPPKDSPLLALPNVVLTPHLGASTEEAQQRVALDVVEQIIDVLQGKPARSPVNLPSLSMEKAHFLQPYLLLVEKIASLLSQISKEAIDKVQLFYQGELSKENPAVLTNAALKGLLEPELGESVNYINAPVVCKTRGVKVEESKSESGGNYANLISIRILTKNKTYSAAGTVYANGEPRIVDLEGFHLNLEPAGYKLITWHTDQPGMVGSVGTLLGKHDINIAEMQLGRSNIRGQAVMVLSIDDQVPDDLMKEIRSLRGFDDAKSVKL